MLFKNFTGLYLTGLLLLNSCQENQETNSFREEEKSSQQTEKIVLDINSQTTFQNIDNFGASDAWSGQFVGNWPDDKKQKIADLLFSQETGTDGNPKGIGLSLWRFNLGAGSAEQGTESGIGDEWRRAPSFLQLNGEYDWNKLQAQVWMAREAQKHGVDQLLLFSNSPHVNLTRNGKAYTSNATHSNLAADKYEEFARYLATATEGLQEKGLNVDYISPVNEPQWDWEDGGQEGTPFWNNEIAGIVKALNKELKERNLSVSIDIPEAGQINYLYEDGNREGRANQVQAFFDRSSENYIGDLEHAGHVISGHSYFTTSPYSRMIDQREKLASAVQEIPDLKYWMTEYCILGGNDGEIDGNGRDPGIDPALYLARVIHSDLTVAGASAWHWWLAISPYDYKDGLIYIDKSKTGGNIYESKMLWALGNYSRFIRPGYKRISIKSSQYGANQKDFLFSAYRNSENNEVVIVLVNSGIKEKSIDLNLKGEEIKSLEIYITSEDKDLEFQETGIAETLRVPKRSITTAVITK